MRERSNHEEVRSSRPANDQTRKRDNPFIPAHGEEQRKSNLLKCHLFQLANEIRMYN